MHSDNVILILRIEFGREFFLSLQLVFIFIRIEDICFSDLIRQYLYLLEIG